MAKAVIGATLGTIEILLAQAVSMRTLKTAAPRSSVGKDHRHDSKDL